MACNRLRHVPINVKKIVKIVSLSKLRRYVLPACSGIDVLCSQDGGLTVSQSSVNFYQTTRHHIPQDSIFQSHYHALQISFKTNIKE
jgi:hypothetical protein